MWEKFKQPNTIVDSRTAYIRNGRRSTLFELCCRHTVAREVTGKREGRDEQYCSLLNRSAGNTLPNVIALERLVGRLAELGAAELAGAAVEAIPDAVRGAEDRDVRSPVTVEIAGRRNIF